MLDEIEKLRWSMIMLEEEIMRDWWTLPYAFARSSQHTAKDLCFF